MFVSKSNPGLSEDYFGFGGSFRNPSLYSMGAWGRIMLVVCLGLTQNVIFPVVSSKVRKGHRVLNVDSELLRVFQDGGVAGELLVIFHWTPG